MPPKKQTRKKKKKHKNFADHHFKLRASRHHIPKQLSAQEDGYFPLCLIPASLQECANRIPTQRPCLSLSVRRRFSRRPDRWGMRGMRRITTWLSSISTFCEVWEWSCVGCVVLCLVWQMPEERREPVFTYRITIYGAESHVEVFGFKEGCFQRLFKSTLYIAHGHVSGGRWQHIQHLWVY